MRSAVSAGLRAPVSSPCRAQPAVERQVGQGTCRDVRLPKPGRYIPRKPPLKFLCRTDQGHRAQLAVRKPLRQRIYYALFMHYPRENDVFILRAAEKTGEQEADVPQDQGSGLLIYYEWAGIPAQSPSR